jgi:hypothetical protein
MAPEGAIIAMRDLGVPHGINEHTLPAEVVTTIIVEPG